MEVKHKHIDISDKKTLTERQRKVGMPHPRFAKDEWGSWGPAQTLYNDGKVVYLFQHGSRYPSPDKCSLMPLRPREEVKTERPSWSPSICLHGHFLGKAIIWISVGTYNKWFLLESGYKLHTRCCMGEMDDHTDACFEKDIIKREFFHSVFGKDRCRQFEKFYRRIGVEEILDRFFRKHRA